MPANLPRAALLACLAAAVFAMPAGATPKTDCEEGLEKIETASNASLNRSQVEKVRRLITNAREMRDQGKFKRCAELVANVHKQMGIK
jgi:hypothetical protein